MTKEEAINKAIELEFGSGNTKGIRAHNSSLVKVAEHLYDLMQPSLPSNLDEAAEDCIQGLIPEAELPATTLFALEYVIEMLYKTFKAGAEWLAGQGETVEGEVVKDIDNNLRVTTKGFSGKEAKFGDKVVVQIRKK
jgi:hypothetical protein